MKDQDQNPLADILHRLTARYLTVRPEGFILPQKKAALRVVDARILAYGAARTLYRSRKPACRSLDGVRSIMVSGRRCATCSHRPACTPQVRIDLIVKHRALRLLLANTSARNFLFYEADLRRQKMTVESVMHRLTVVSRGTWGEVRFATQPEAN